MSQTEKRVDLFQQIPISAEDLKYTYVVGPETKISLLQNGLILMSDRSSSQDMTPGFYRGIVGRKDAFSKDGGRILSVPFSQIKDYLTRGSYCIVMQDTDSESSPKILLSIVGFEKTGEPATPAPQAEAHAAVRGTLDRKPASKEAQIYALLEPAIRKALAERKFTPLQAAAIAKKLGNPEAVRLLLNPATSIEKAAEFTIGLIGKQREALLGNMKALQSVGHILKRHVVPSLGIYWRHAESLMSTDLYEAIEVYREAATHYKDLRLYIRLACCLYQSGELEEAMDWVEKTKKLPGYDPEFLPEYLKREGFFRYNYARNSCERPKELLSPEDGLRQQQPYIDRGNAFYQAKDYAKAAAEYRKVLKLNPKLQYIPNEYKDVYSNFGLALYYTGDYQGALEQFYELIRLYDKDGAPSAHYNAGVILVKTGNFDAAISEYREAISQDPKDVDTYRNLGNLLVPQGRVEEALLCFQEIKKLNPSFPNIDKLIAECQVKVETRKQTPVEDPERVQELQKTEVGQRALVLADRLKGLLEKLKAELPPLEGQANFQFVRFDEMLEVGNISKAFPEGGYIAKRENRPPYGGWDYAVDRSLVVFGGGYDVMRGGMYGPGKDFENLLKEDHKKYLHLKFLYYLLIKNPKKLFHSGEHQDITNVCIESSWLLGPCHFGSLLGENGEPNLNTISEYIVEEFREGGISFREMSSLSNTLEGKSGDRITAGDILYWVIDRLEKAWDATGGKLLG